MLINAQEVYKSYGQTPVLRGLSFSAEAGSHSAIVGASGSGKSTLLYLLGGLDRPDSGKIMVGDSAIHSMDDAELCLYRNQKVGFVFQFHFLLSSMKCFDNILLPARIANSENKDLRETVQHLAKELQVEHCLKKYPYQLSGGEQQRINIIRALCLRPQLLLCDEPTGNLDSKNSDKVIELLVALAKDFHATLIVVTHDEKIASRLPRKITIEDGLIIS